MSSEVDPNDIFTIEEKIGEGSYGSVLRAIHKNTKRNVAIKLIPVESDLKELYKEIEILRSCKSDHIVRYYGSYCKDKDLWIVMEYCGAGSMSDLMCRGRFTLKEEEIRIVISQVLLGLSYLHKQHKIHRDIKAGNILLTENGVAKLADFGVSAQLDSTMSKRKTVIGTPFWMAPEVIKEDEYNCNADIWSLGITAIELAEGVPPYSNIHPMRAIFMIPNRPPPRLQSEGRWSKEFVDFIKKCLVVNPAERSSADQLLEHPFVKDTVDQIVKKTISWSVMTSMISRLREMKARSRNNELRSSKSHEKIPPKQAAKPESHDTMLVKPEPPKAPVQRITKQESHDTMLVKPEPPKAPIQKITKPESPETISVKPVHVKPFPLPLPGDRLSNPISLRLSDSSNQSSPAPRNVPMLPSKQGPSASRIELPQPATAAPHRSTQGHPPYVGNKSSGALLPANSSHAPMTVLDQFVQSVLPSLPTKTANTTSMVEWIQLQNKGKLVMEQFKADLRILAGAYKDEMDKIISSMEKIM